MTSGRVARGIAAIAGGAANRGDGRLDLIVRQGEREGAGDDTPRRRLVRRRPRRLPRESVNPTEKAPRIPTGPNPFSPSAESAARSDGRFPAITKPSRTYPGVCGCPATLLCWALVAAGVCGACLRPRGPPRCAS